MRWLAVLAVCSATAVAAAAATRHESSPARSASVQDPRCPTIVGGPSNRPTAVLRAFRAQVKAAFDRPAARLSVRGYRVTGLLSLDVAGDLGPAVRASTLRRVATRACGARAASGSWVVLISFPDYPDALHGFHVAYLAHTAKGWRIWYDWVARDGAADFIAEGG